MNWTLDQIEAFVTAARCGSFSAAARTLGKAQSRVSTSVANLEADLGVELFDRSKRLPQLTPVGEQLLVDAQSLLRLAQQLDSKALLASTGEPLALKVAIDEAVSIDGIHSVFVRLSERFPQLRMTITSGSRDDIARAVAERNADLGVMFRYPSLPDSLEFQSIGQVEKVLIVGGKHRLAGSSSITLDQLSHDKQLLICSGDGISGDSPLASNYWHLDSYYVICDLVSRNQGWAIVPRHIVNSHWLQHPVQIMRCDELQGQLQLQLGLVQRRETVVSNTVRWLVNELQQCTVEQ